MEILAIIPARGGSRGIPQKNIKLLAGKPMIGWTIEAATHARTRLRVVVSTDNQRIAEVARSFGAEVPFLRPNELATDRASPVDVALHTLNWFAQSDNYIPKTLMLLQPTSPLRVSSDIDAAVELFQANNAEAVVSVSEVRHPVAWLRKIGAGGELMPWRSDLVPTRRQDAEQLYQLNGAIYLVSREVFLQEKTFLPERTIAYVMPPDRSIDIDVPWDFRLADLILRDAYAS